MGFILNIMASIIATIICLFFASVISKRWRKVYYAISHFVLNTNVAYTYHKREEAENDIQSDVAHSNKFKFLGGRGELLKNPPYRDFLQNSNIETQILLPIPNPNNVWLQRRVTELKANNAMEYFSCESLVADIEAVIIHFKDKRQYEERQLRLYDALHIGRIVILDNSAYLTLYQQGIVGRQSPIFKYYRDSDMYTWLERYFDTVFQSSIDAKSYIES